jgi:hypothetical protein
MNLAHTQSFSELVEQDSGIVAANTLLMPKYAESMCMHTIQTLLDVIVKIPGIFRKTTRAAGILAASGFHTYENAAGG